MKPVIAVLIAALVGFGGGYLFLSKKHAEKAIQQSASSADWEAEKAFLEQQLAEAKKKQVEVEKVEAIAGKLI